MWQNAARAERHGLFLAFRLARSHMRLYYGRQTPRHAPSQQARASRAELTTELSCEAEALTATSYGTPTGESGGEGEDGGGRDSPGESWTRTRSSSGPIGAFFISRRMDQNDIISPQLRQTVIQLFQKSTLESGGTLDRRRFEVFEAVQRASASSVWYTR